MLEEIMGKENSDGCRSFLGSVRNSSRCRDSPVSKRKLWVLNAERLSSHFPLAEQKHMQLDGHVRLDFIPPTLAIESGGASSSSVETQACSELLQQLTLWQGGSFWYNTSMNTWSGYEHDVFHFHYYHAVKIFIILFSFFWAHAWAIFLSDQEKRGID